MKYYTSEIARITEGTLYGPDLEIESVLTDSRSHGETQNTIFCAISGANHDGHQFVYELFDRGVRCFLVEKLAPINGTQILVNNTLTAIQTLAKHHRSRFKGTVVAITGSNGKTMVKEYIAQLWMPSEGHFFRSPKSYNSQLGVALSLLMIKGDERVVVIEAGISRPDEMVKLEAMIRPQIGIMTNIGEAHNENFTSNRQKLAEKLQLFKESEYVICNNKDYEICRALGTKAVKWHSDPDPESQNKAAALMMYTILNIKHKNVNELQNIAMRLEVQPGIMGSSIINDSYNCDLTSVIIALNYQSRQANQQKIVILSDIFQSGYDDDELYSKVAQYVHDHSVNLFVGIGTRISNLKHLFEPNSLFFDNTNHFIELFDSQLIANASVLIKGSRAFGFEKISYLFEQKSHTTKLEVNLGAMVANLNHYRSKLSENCRLMAMVKANSYGSGTKEVAEMLQHQRVDYLAVAFADEGVTLRKSGIHLPIVVLNADPSSFSIMANNDLEPEIYSLESLQEYIVQINRIALSQTPIHIKLDTGMHRLGFMEKEIDPLIELLKRNRQIWIKSIFSHLAASDDPHHDEFTRRQIELFDQLSSKIITAFPSHKIIRHICNSAAIERFPEAHFDMVRLGIGLYGFGDKKLENVLTLATKIVQIKFIKPGESIGYGRNAFTSKNGMPIGIIPIGYADGLNRHLGCGVGKVSINGTLCPIVGNICMDTCMIDLSNVPQVAAGETVTIFGINPSVMDQADWLDTIPYEILTSVSSRIKRVYIDE